MENIIVYKDPGAYTCFPAIIRREDDELLVTFRRAGGFSLEAVRQGKYDHVDKGARIGMSRSKDGGKTWESAKIFPVFDPECGEQDPSINQFKDGSLMINFFQWRVVPEEEKDRLGYPARQQHDGSWSDVEGPCVIRSFDGGLTWDDQPIMVDSSPLPRGGTSDAVVELPDGTLIMGIYGADYGSPYCRAYTVKSKDRGKTWGSPALIAADPEKKISFEEPAIVLTKEGYLLTMVRSGAPRNYQYLYQAISKDGGETWTDLHETPMWGHPAHVLQLSDGRLLCTYGHRRPPYGIRGCFSSDGGQTWDIENEVILRADGESVDLGYPCSAELSDGTIVTVYYIHGSDLIRHIAATCWQAG
jgi:hypothetical protein